ncbi:GDP-mannose 4,6-dehydratase [Candidatus Nitrosocaldus cavascurensis]|jgi:nucleoside-diphosphate-sugar epimerase|uniref:UDP-glucuronate decarboxylase n=1 Tax=Candidatus Nitrosocaldus cavascurensis TaxID=2058097 RepID=A0A2K5AQ63_9ARCH|nr:protein of unknown function [Candidatus Nitrosocaldus cavascurensis]
MNYNTNLANSNILVTGGAGFIGSHLVDRLLADNLNIHVIDNLSTGNIAHISRWSSNSSFRFFKLDLVTDAHLLDNALSSNDYFIPSCSKSRCKIE